MGLSSTLIEQFLVPNFIASFFQKKSSFLFFYNLLRPRILLFLSPR